MMLALQLCLFSISSIIHPENNTVFFPGRDLNIQWNNFNKSDYLNIQMYVNEDNNWKTYIKDHHLFSVTTDSENCCGENSYNIFLPYYFSELWNNKFKIEIKNIGIENPEIQSIYFSITGINVNMYYSYVTWNSNYLNNYSGFIYDSSTSLYNYKQKDPKITVANWVNETSGTAAWGIYGLNGGYRVLIISEDNKNVGISNTVYYTTTSTSSTTTSTSSTTTSTSSITTSTSSTTTSTTPRTSTSTTNTSLYPNSLITSRTPPKTQNTETNTTKKLTSTTTSTTTNITIPVVPLINVNTTEKPEYHVSKKNKKWLIIWVFFGSLIILFCLLLIILFSSKDKNKQTIHPTPILHKASQTRNNSSYEVQIENNNYYNKLNRSRVQDNQIYGCNEQNSTRVTHRNPVYESNSDVDT